MPDLDFQRPLGLNAHRQQMPHEGGTTVRRILDEPRWQVEGVVPRRQERAHDDKRALGVAVFLGAAHRAGAAA
eukprot:7836466-Alexandrium_andersonii.AAC.1